MSEQHEEESLRRWAREQADIERQTDALVLRTLTAMVTAAEDLKSKLRRDTEAMLEEYRKTKRGLENEISLSTAERQRFRREIDLERESILSAAKEEAREIVEGAKQEREQLLHETREMEQRLRGIESQIRSLFGQSVAAPASDDIDDASPAAPVRPLFTPAAFPQSPAPAAAAPTLTPVTSPASAPPAPPPSASAAPVADDEEAAPALVEDEADLVDEDEDEDEPPTTAITTATARSASTPTTPPPVVTATTPPASAAVPAAAAQQRRLIELVFDNVPGYQQASALERAVDDLVPDGEVDILDFERGQLVLNVYAVNLDVLAEQLVATSTAVLLELEAIEGDRATFHCN